VDDGVQFYTIGTEFRLAINKHGFRLLHGRHYIYRMQKAKSTAHRQMQEKKSALAGRR
jgi:hypothetical protein